jgi:hypothetical protein
VLERETSFVRVAEFRDRMGRTCPMVHLMWTGAIDSANSRWQVTAIVFASGPAYRMRRVLSDNPAGSALAADQEAIAGIVRRFFAAFASGPDSAARLDGLRALFLAEAVIVRTCGGEPAVYGVDSFIAPRQALLSGGTLVDFCEWELRGRTEIFGDIAQHFGSYAKAGVQDGTPFNARGMKSLQFVRTAAGWRISAVAWDDERDGLEIESD